MSAIVIFSGERSDWRCRRLCGGDARSARSLPVGLEKEDGPVQVRILLAGVLLAGVTLVAGAEPAAGRPGETPAERIARETKEAVRASEQAALTTPLAPRPRRQAAAGPLTGRWTTCQLPE